MNLNRIRNALNFGIASISSTTLSHYYTKLLAKQQEASKAQAPQALQESGSSVTPLEKVESKLEHLQEQHNIITSNITEALSTLNQPTENLNNATSQETITEASRHLDSAVMHARHVARTYQECASKITRDQFTSIDELKGALERMARSSERILSELEKFRRGGNGHNFSPNLEVYQQKFYSFLDSLTVLQEASLVNILLFICIFIFIIQILLLFFGEEVIKFLQLEKRLPKLAFFIKLRSKFQKLSIFIFVLLLLVVCIVGVGINLLVFAV